MKVLLLSTCGTSVLTNGTSDEVRSWVHQRANRRELSGDELDYLQKLADARQAELLAAGDAQRRRLSAEWNGIARVLDRLQPTEVFHYLVHSDTRVGEQSAAVVTVLLRAAKQSVAPLSASGLRTDDLQSFREAVADLTKQLESIDFNAQRTKGWTTVFNLTAGFKSLTAYLQAIGMHYADRCCFLFEGSDTVIEIPRLPVRLAEVDEVRASLDLFRRLAVGYSVSTADAASTPESLLLSDSGQVTTSVWGDVVWARVRGRLLGERLLKPLSARLVVEAIERVCAGLSSDRRVRVNEALDALSAHLDHGRPMLKSVTFKKLVGNSRGRSTHELYAWSDLDARRLYGHFDDDGTFILDELGAHL